jgi:hypothetical protein
MFTKRPTGPTIKLRLRLRTGLYPSTPNGAEQPPGVAGSRFRAGWLHLPALAHARASRKVIKKSALRADNYEQFTTAKASMATIDVRQVERKAGRRRWLRVAVPASALALATSAVLGLLGGTGRQASPPQLPSWPQSSTLV